jgi:hypothetical protein
MRFSNPTTVRYLEEFGVEIIAVHCRECNQPIGDYFADDAYPEYCDACDPDNRDDDYDA